MEDVASESACSLSGASCEGVLSCSTASNPSLSKYYESVWENAAYVYRRRSSLHQLYTRITSAESIRPPTSSRGRRSVRQVWDLGEGGWESSEEDLSALDERGGASSDAAGSLVSQRLLVPALRVTSEVEQCTKTRAPRKVSFDDGQCIDRSERSLDSGGEGSGSSLESHQFWSLDPSNAMSSTISVTLKRKVLGGSSPFGVSLLGGVRDSRGQFQTFVNSVDERHHRGEGSGIREGDIVTQWNGKKVAGMSFEAVCKMMMEAEEQSLHNEEETEARVELTRSAEAKQTFQQISRTLEVEMARAKESLAAPLLSNLKKEWIEQPGSIQVSIKYDCRSSSLTLGVMHARLHPLPRPAGQSKAESPKILVNVYLIPVPASSDAHWCTKLVQPSPSGYVVWKHTFPPCELHLHQLMHTDLQVIVWECSHDRECTFLGEVNLLLSDTTLVDLRGPALWYPLGEHNPNLGALPPPRLARPKHLSIFNRLQTHLKLSSQWRSTQNLVVSPGKETPKTSVPPRVAVSLSDDSTFQNRRNKPPRRSASIPCIVEELMGSQPPSTADLDSFDSAEEDPGGVMPQSGEGDLRHMLVQRSVSSCERVPACEGSVSSERTESTWRGFLESSSTIEGGSLSRTNSSFALFSSIQGRVSESDSVFESDDEIIDGGASPCLPAPKGSCGLAETQQSSHLTRRNRMFVSTSNLADASEDKSGQQSLSSHRWAQSLSNLTEENPVCEVPQSEKRERKTSLLTRVWRKLSKTEDCQGIDSLCQLGPAQFVPANNKSKQLNAVGRIELSFQWINTTVLEITFIQMAMTSKKFTGDCVVCTTAYCKGEGWVSRQRVSLHFQHQTTSDRSVFVNTEQSNTVQLSMRSSCGRMPKAIVGDIWLSIAELASHCSTMEARVSWYPLLKP